MRDAPETMVIVRTRQQAPAPDTPQRWTAAAVSYNRLVDLPYGAATCSLDGRDMVIRADKVGRATLRPEPLPETITGIVERAVTEAGVSRCIKPTDEIVSQIR